MNKLKNFLKKDKQVLRVSAMILLVFVVTLVLACVGFYQLLHNTIHDETSFYLSEMSYQTAENINRVIDSNFAKVATLNTMLKNSTGLSEEETVKALLLAQKDNWGYQEVMLGTTDGRVIRSESTVQGGFPQIAEDSPLKTLSEGRILFVDRDKSGGIERFNFACVIDEISVLGKKVNIISTAFPLNNFHAIVANNLFGGSAYTHVVRADGTILISGTDKNVDGWGANFLTSLKDGVKVDQDKNAVDKMIKEMADKKAGIVACDFNETQRYVSYRPIDNSDGWHLLTVVPVSVMNEKSNLMIRLTMLFCCFVVAVLVVLLILFICSVYRYRRRLENIAFIDSVTGGMTLQKFYVDVAEIMKNSDTKKALIYTNIEKFKVTNEQFGMETGNALIRGILKGVTACISSTERIGRIMADHLCVLVNYESEEKLVERFYEWHVAILKELKDKDIALFFPALQLGVYVVGEKDLPMPFMIDRAKLAMKEKANILNNKMSYSLYDEKEHIKLLREKQLEDCMDRALSSGEFEVYLQPKYETSTKKIGSAEALTRWTGNSFGMVYPDEFIPLFEKNGFIIQLDLWVFEQVAKRIRSWINEGKKPIPISVNCSRRNLKTPHFIDNYVKLLNQYDIPAKYIEIELTESIMYEDTDALVEMIEELHKIGFTCSIDDFGSGYSSLSMIQGIPVDILKLDKIFFRNFFTVNERAGSVIEAIIRMAKSLSMKTVAEGVELVEQVNMLEEVGCDFIQGFVFSKPVPISDFEKLAFPVDEG